MLGGTLSNATYVGERVRTDASGNVYVAGTYTKTLSVDGQTINQNNGAGAGSAFVMKFDSTGKAVLAIGSEGNGSDEYGYDVFVDTNGDLYLSGSYNGQAKFVNVDEAGTTEILTTAANGGEEKAFVAKYAQSTKKWVWAKGFIGSGNNGGAAVAVTGSSNDTITIGGTISGNIVIGTADLGATDGSFVARLRRATVRRHGRRASTRPRTRRSRRSSATRRRAPCTSLVCSRAR